MPLLVGLSGKRKISYIPVFPLTRIFIAHRNRLFARLSLDLLELKVSFTMRSMLELWKLYYSFITFIYTGLLHIDRNRNLLSKIKDGAWSNVRSEMVMSELNGALTKPSSLTTFVLRLRLRQAWSDISGLLAYLMGP